ncbi:D-alanyl-D-alanine carboxypeptidase family protein [Stakelama pacifica]|uniref:serine-type D-Ala-D-Ala carboxypeptidase n=1 Tax=Stakelama pacifica TaxID=517720 RepID=A0A4R6FXK6_9SPHN|nr:D-alanyl-D-alanine carboxypeptidase family protein [Stakelama pacifica]MAW99168.1 D-alanyl-D-alanine carboxypeptidase [Sphingomonas sp.]TDN86729.1 D-alanyl-D-alanine carboxypeptidase (penicillin-binding protein 5/6) [Stakelama pacifica]
MKKLLTAALLASIVAAPGAAQAPPFQTPAPIAFMKDLSSDAVLFAKQPDKRIPPASMAKMMTVYVAFDLIKKGELKQDQKIHVQRETWAKWHSQGSTMFLSPDEDVSVENLLYGIVTLSGNDACVVLAEGISGTEQAFTALMNQRAKALGMSNSHFGTSNGWPDEGQTYVTARDLATLAEATIENFPDLYKKYYSKQDFTWGQTMGGKAITQANRDPLLGYVDGADGLKTGHTEEAGYGFTGSAEQNGRRLVMVLAGLDTYTGRAQQSRQFMNWGFRAWKAKPIVKKGKQVATAEVQQGSESSVGLVAPRDLTVTIPSGTSPDMTGKVVYQGPIKAPIQKGQHIADLIINTPGMGPQKLPLVAAEDVSEAGFFGRAWAGLMSLFG